MVSYSVKLNNTEIVRSPTRGHCGSHDHVELKDESGKNTINLTELEQSVSCLMTPRLTSQSWSNPSAVP